MVYTGIRDILLVVDNLTELNLHGVSPSITLQLFSDCPPESVRFRLRHFTYILSSKHNPELLKFLSCQSRLEELVCMAHEVGPRPFLHDSTAPAESSVLPQLKSLTGAPEITLLLVPGRPVSKITINWISLQMTGPVLSGISLTTAPLVYLSVEMPNSSKSGEGVLMWLSGLSRFHESLETFSFRMTTRVSGPNTVQLSTNR
ncbi:hypothetical protein FRC12_010271 [Ceratobasidium sp. 428]|nr:hypothetical protein FRC12_010271 [Ceratobasidium sp. 428]